MNIQEFETKFAGIKQAEKIEMQCEHPKCDSPKRFIGMGAARRNILKNGGNQFICGTCDKRFNNPMNRRNDVNRSKLGIINVVCNKCGEYRSMDGTCYYGSLSEPYMQTCLACAQTGKTISKEQKEKISDKLSGRKLTQDHKNSISRHMKINEEGIERGKINLVPGAGGGWNKGLRTPNETKKKQSAAKLGKKYTDIHKLNISQGRKKMLKDTGGFSDEHKQKLRKKTLEQYSHGFNPNTHHLSGWHVSPKAGRIFYRSSYEKKAYMLLDSLSHISRYETETLRINYLSPTENKISTFIVDVLAFGADANSKLAIEIKPRFWLSSLINMAKIDALNEWSTAEKMPYEIWDEFTLFGEEDTSKKIDKFIDWIKSGATGDLDNISEEIVETRRFKARLKQKKYYDSKLSEKIVVNCDFCKKEHEVRKISYEKCIEKKGRYICAVELGHIGGSKPKTKLIKENPYAAEGKKQCNKCQNIKLFSEFSPDKSRRDGYCSMCKPCRSAKMKAAYDSKKNDEGKMK